MAHATKRSDSKSSRRQDGRGKWGGEPGTALSSALLVTGSAGFIGQAVMRKLAEAEQTVVALYHHRLPEAAAGVYPVCSDLGSPELMAAPLRGVDTVLHLAWEGGLAGPQQALPTDPFQSDLLTPNLGGLRNVITAMERAGTRRLIFVSAAGTARFSQSVFVREKYLAELLVLNARIPERIIIRPSVVWGGAVGSDRFLSSLMRLMRFPIYPLPRKPDGLAPLHVDDLATLLVRACSCPMNEGAVFIESHGGENYEIDELCRMVSEVCLKKPRLALKGALGHSLVPFFERETEDRRVEKFTHFLALAGCRSAADSGLRVEGELNALVATRMPAFRERLNL